MISFCVPRQALIPKFPHFQIPKFPDPRYPGLCFSLPFSTLATQARLFYQTKPDNPLPTKETPETGGEDRISEGDSTSSQIELLFRVFSCLASPPFLFCPIARGYQGLTMHNRSHWNHRVSRLVSLIYSAEYGRQWLRKWYLSPQLFFKPVSLCTWSLFPSSSPNHSGVAIGSAGITAQCSAPYRKDSSLQSQHFLAQGWGMG